MLISFWNLKSGNKFILYVYPFTYKIICRIRIRHFQILVGKYGCVTPLKISKRSVEYCKQVSWFSSTANDNIPVILEQLAHKSDYEKIRNFLYVCPIVVH